MPVPVENVFDGVEGVNRAALVGVGPRGAERPHLVVEADPRAPRDELTLRLHRRAKERGVAEVIEGYLFHAAFPVDVRHNAKIHRIELKRWAEEQLL